ncbi:hypothetical protein L3X38_043022 [Prunus dulcis]|uniref:HAT C-terminal dimerisation domain-containing protein n=1 Tax=Prunus dulcis TaxID=3755 RepID=A0AAD4UXS3_PRUDU|nr:hypothetical protein L3X38_043022 [Prunus dulcis]
MRALVVVAKGNENIATFFTTASSVVNTIGASSKRRDALREQQQKDIMETLEIDDLETGRGLNQETTLKHPCDTRWNSYYDTLLSINIMFHPVVKVLEWIVDDVNQDNLAFDKHKILCFAKFYPQEFNDRDLMKLEDQLGLYIVDMQSITEFSSLNGITDLAEKLVNTGRSIIYNYVYLLLTLALVLPVATASVGRAFSAMNIVKTPLRNKMGNQWLSDSLVVYIEKDVFSCISNANIMRRFHDMKPRRQQL